MSDCLIVGGGPAGLAVGAQLKRRGIDAPLLERGSAPGAKWSERYDRLRINTSAFTSHLPGRRFPLSYGRWPTRDQLIAYYRRYADDHALEVRTNVTAERVEREDDGWSVTTNRGESRARAVVIATGKDGAPRIPAWRGRESFRGSLIHSADYRDPAPFAGLRVLVVGAGSSAVDICLDLAGARAREVWLSIRTPPHLARRSAGGLPADLLGLPLSRLPRSAYDRTFRAVRRLTIGDLTPYGLPAPEDGLTARVLERGMIPTIDPGGFVRALKQGNVKVVPAVERLTEDGAVLSEGTDLGLDAIIACTGYGRGLEPLVGHLCVLDERGHPKANGGVELPNAPGLFFIGFSDVLTGNLRQIRLDSRHVARTVARTLRSSGNLPVWPPPQFATGAAASLRPPA